ncbi:hypothetical protein AUP68_07836 [Ilyonectria robusta]
MSGFEVVGVVLGVLPLAIEALKTYKSTLSSMKNVERSLKALIQDLETEQVRLRTTCEVLLEGIVPLSMIDTLLEKPFGPQWEPYDHQLRLRLWTSSGKFEEQVAEMQNAAEELKNNLSIQAAGKGKILTDRVTILQELKRGTSFTLKRKDYENIISRIKTGNAALHELAGQNCRLEPNRRRRSQARVINLIRGLSQSIFNALQNATTCCCAKSHRICLELVHRKAVLVPNDVEEKIARNFNFHAVLGSFGGSIPSQNSETGEMALSDPPARWACFSIQLEEPDHEPATAPVSLAPTLNDQKPKRMVRWPASLRPSTEGKASATKTLVEVSKSSALHPELATKYELPRVSNLCQVIPRWRKGPAVSCYGYVADIHRKFGLYPQENQLESHTTITLRQLLEGHLSDSQVGYIGKLEIALAISTSILHLYNTAWLTKMITLDDVLFFRGKEDVSLSNVQSLSQPFVAKSISEANQSHVGQSQQDTFTQQRPINLMVLSLGVLLIQVIIGKAIETLDMAECMDLDAILAMNQAGKSFNGQILESGGMNYTTVVDWCLNTVFSTGGLENENVSQNFYVEVVARLEEDVKILTAS